RERAGPGLSRGRRSGRAFPAISDRSDHGGAPPHRRGLATRGALGSETGARAESETGLARAVAGRSCPTFQTGSVAGEGPGRAVAARDLPRGAGQPAQPRGNANSPEGGTAAAGGSDVRRNRGPVFREDPGPSLGRGEPPVSSATDQPRGRAGYVAGPGSSR